MIPHWHVSQEAVDYFLRGCVVGWFLGMAAAALIFMGSSGSGNNDRGEQLPQASAGLDPSKTK
jgi:hypothetical protein